MILSEAKVFPAENFADLVRKEQSRLYNFILKNIGNPADAEELAQQTFVEAYAALASFRGQSEFSTWLFGIAMNLVRNHLSRAPHRRYRFVGEEELETMPADGGSTVDNVGFAQAVRKLSRELDSLPRELRDVLIMVAVNGIAYDEAADLMSIPIGTVRSRLSRARAALRERMPEVVQIIGR